MLGAFALYGVSRATGGGPRAPHDPHLAARDALVALGFAVPEAEAALAGSQGTTAQRVKEGLAALRRGGPS